MPITLDIGGEGRLPMAWNLNRSRFKTLGPGRRGPIRRLIVGRGDAIPLADGSADGILVERTPLTAAVLHEIARVISPNGTVVLRHVPLPRRDRHSLACEMLGGRATRALRRLGGTVIQETTILVGRPSPAAAHLLAAEPSIKSLKLELRVQKLELLHLAASRTPRHDEGQLRRTLSRESRAMPTTFPAYLELYESGELARRVEWAISSLEDCTACPRDCHVDRLHDESSKAICRTGRYARVGSHFPHFGEEDCLRGTNGSGTIFFGWCNLRCVFCQNFDLSWEGLGREVRPQRMADMMLELEARGCHNINFVTPEHVVPQMLEGLFMAVERGLRLPIVYNTSAYDSMESLELLDGVIDIYMPDFKFWEAEESKWLAKAADYPEVARRTIKEMYRQVGDLVFDESGLARRGLLVRHLVMPNGLGGTRRIMQYLAREISADTYVNVMAQYRPAGRADRYEPINRRITTDEYVEAIEIARAEGLRRLDERAARRMATP